MNDGHIWPLRAVVQARVQDGRRSVWRDGLVVGRTLEDDPRYDVRFPDGSIHWNIPAHHLRRPVCAG